MSNGIYMCKKKVKNLLFLITASSLLFGCSTSNLSGPQKSYNEEEIPQFLDGEAQLVIFRDDDSNEDLASPIIRIDDFVVGALQPGQYTTSKICQGNNQVRLSQREGGSSPKTVNVRAENGETVYVLVSDLDETLLDVTVLSYEEAEDYLSDSDYVSYLKNRKQYGCKPILLRSVELAADALFRFDSSRLSDIVGRNALDKLAKEIIQSEIKVDRIKVVGHTDRLGGAEYNLRLSEERAATVSEYLRLKGVLGLIDIEGKGAAEPVTTNCQGNRANAALIECLQPDRRVSIELWGIQQEVEDELPQGQILDETAQ
jgi:outer membrane protein OmpA-like peptidoglycan-associated protein